MCDDFTKCDGDLLFILECCHAGAAKLASSSVRAADKRRYTQSIIAGCGAKEKCSTHDYFAFATVFSEALEAHCDGRDRTAEDLAGFTRTELRGRAGNGEKSRQEGWQTVGFPEYITLNEGRGKIVLAPR